MPLTHDPSLGREEGDWGRPPSGGTGWLSSQSLPFHFLPGLRVRLRTGYVGRKRRTGPPRREGRQPPRPPLPRGQATGVRAHPAPKLKADALPGGGAGKTPSQSSRLTNTSQTLAPSPSETKRRVRSAAHDSWAAPSGPDLGAGDPEILGGTQSGSRSQLLPRSMALCHATGSQPPTGLVTGSGAKNALGSGCPPSFVAGSGEGSRGVCGSSTGGSSLPGRRPPRRARGGGGQDRLRARCRTAPARFIWSHPSGSDTKPRAVCGESSKAGPGSRGRSAQEPAPGHPGAHPGGSTVCVLRRKWGAPFRSLLP